MVYRLYYENQDGAAKTLSTSENGDAVLFIEDDGERKRVVLKAKSRIKLNSYQEIGFKFRKLDNPEKDEKGDLYFMNGYQSWTDTREFYGDAQERNVKRLPKRLVERFAFDRYGDATFYEYDKRVLHGYDVFYVKGENGAFIFNLNYKNAYLIFELVRKTGELSLLSDLNGKVLETSEEFTVADYVYAGSYEDGLKVFDKFFPLKKTEKIFGYTSWYNYYQNINEEIILRDLAALGERVNLFQIDDGYETFVGDWLSVDKAKFPNGLKKIADAAHEKGYKAGIWLAPFVAEERSETFKTHPEWFKKGNDGKAVKCGSNWSGFYALDIENEEVKKYISTCLKTYADMGFDLFKLDFLYAASLPEYEGKTRSQAAEYAYDFLREVLGDKLILGCGATLFNAIGKFDYMRIGPDVSLEFDDVWFMRFMHRERISTKTTLQNTIYRSFLNGRFFGCDPDVFLLRDDNIKLFERQREALLTINALFGSVLMTSDNVAAYDDEKRGKLGEALNIFYGAKDVKFKRKGKKIYISYHIDGEEKNIVYDTERGEINAGQN